VTTGRWLELAWSEHQGHECIRVQGWTETELQELTSLAPSELDQRLVVFPSEFIESGTHIYALQPFTGSFKTDGTAICFVPRFPFLDGTSYSLVVGSLTEARNPETPEIWTIKRLPRAGEATTNVLGIYPSAHELPVNQLKFYVHFSSPMSEGWAVRAIHVHRADNGEPLSGVFLAMEPELWDRERRRLTLLLEPGRIKRGLAPNMESGYPLVEGVPIVISIEAEFRDATGRPLRTGAERCYEVAKPVRIRVESANWQYHYPDAGSTDPLAVEFDRPLDYALLRHCLWVTDAAGVPVVGQESIGSGEWSWQFEPRLPWEDSRYVVMVDPRLEDLAGNSLIRVFDRDLMRAEDVPDEVRHAVINFTPAFPLTPPS
jgi:hypothetical protein